MKLTRPDFPSRTLLILLFGFLSGCLFPGKLPLENRDNVARGRKEAIATAHPAATDAAAQVLLNGGNAVDAAVTASFVLSVVRPQSTGIGGGGFMLLHKADPQSSILAYDFRERAPGTITSDFYVQQKIVNAKCAFKKPSVYGATAAGTPGLVQGLAEIHSEHGTLPWSRLIEPAIKLADSGFPVYPGLAQAIQLKKDKLKCFPETAKLLLPGGHPLRQGETLKQTGLAETLRYVARHPKTAFKNGPIIEELLNAAQKGYSKLTSADFRKYTVKRRQPVRAKVQGVTLFSFPPPSSGGIHIAQMLEMARLLPIVQPQTPSDWMNDSFHRHLYLAEILKSAFADRAHYLGDPDSMRVDPSELLSPDYLRKKTESLGTRPPSKVKPNGIPEESPETTHFSIIDRFGNAVASTQTINTYFGSGMVAGNTGIFLNNEMDDFWTGKANAFGLTGNSPNRVAPDKTPLSSMSPTLLLDYDQPADSRVTLAIGSPGGPRIISATFLSLFNLLFRGMSLQSAIAEPRIHHQWSPDTLYMEGGKSSDLLDFLKARGINTETGGTFFGDVEAVARTPNGDLTAVTDHRSEGKAWAR